MSRNKPSTKVQDCGEIIMLFLRNSKIMKLTTHRLTMYFLNCLYSFKTKINVKLLFLLHNQISCFPKGHQSQHFIHDHKKRRHVMEMACDNAHMYTLLSGSTTTFSYSFPKTVTKQIFLYQAKNRHSLLCFLKNGFTDD